jgi:hypothetical protein
MIDRLTELTPELSDTERRLFFGARSSAEREDLADLFDGRTDIERQNLYGVLREWLQGAVPTIGAN